MEENVMKFKEQVANSFSKVMDDENAMAFTDVLEDDIVTSMELQGIEDDNEFSAKEVDTAINFAIERLVERS